jgi:hypothetical protein
MPERLLNKGRVGATGQLQGGVGVPEILPAYVRQPRPLEQRLEVAVDDVLSVEGSTIAGGEYETVLLPVCACPNPS